MYKLTEKKNTKYFGQECKINVIIEYFDDIIHLLRKLK
jgi:hypothetical protein